MIKKALNFLLIISVFFAPRLFSQETDDEKKKLKLLADFRYRFEADWDSRRFEGSYRADRNRMRARLRFGFNYQWNDHFSFGARMRSGVATNIQSPHFNIGHENFSSKSFRFDRYNLKANYSKAWWWLGKNGFPFWKQNELWWDDDVNPEGVALGFKSQVNKTQWQPTFAFFVPYHDHNGNIEESQILAAQLKMTLIR